MNFEAANVVVSRPNFFSVDEQFAAAEFMINAKSSPTHIQCDFEAIQRQARVIRMAAFEAIRFEGRWPKQA